MTASASTWSRTKNLLIKSQMLYQLSYRGVAAGILLSAGDRFKRRTAIAEANLARRLRAAVPRCMCCCCQGFPCFSCQVM